MAAAFFPMGPNLAAAHNPPPPPPPPAPLAATTPPPAPTGLTAAGVTTSQITLAWTASTDNVGVTGYEVYRDGGAAAIGAVAGTVFSDTGLAPASTHTYTV